MKPNYANMPINVLVDMLAEETQKFTHLLTYKQYGKEYEDSKKKIHRITEAIQGHRENEANKNRDKQADPSS